MRTFIESLRASRGWVILGLLAALGGALGGACETVPLPQVGGQAGSDDPINSLKPSGDDEIPTSEEPVPDEEPAPAEDPADDQVLGSKPDAPITSTSSQPTGLAIQALPPNQIELTWKDHSANETGFVVQRNLNRAGWVDYATVGADTTQYVDADALPGTRHCYRVIATDGVNRSPASTQACILMPPLVDLVEPEPTTGTGTQLPPRPAAPSGLQINALDGQVILNWTDNSMNEDGFEVWRYTSSGKWLVYATVGPGVTTFVDTGATVGASYCYRVRGFNAGGTGASCPLKCLTVPAGGTGGTGDPTCPDGNCPPPDTGGGATDPEPEVDGPVYYVSPAGRPENDGSAQRPWPDVAYALAQVGGGNTIIMKSGVYSGPVRVDYPGTAERPTIVKAEVRWQAIIDGSPNHGFKTNDDQDWISTDWVVVDGLEIRNCTKSGVKFYGNNNTVRNCWIHDNLYHGIESHKRYALVAENNLIESNGLADGIALDGHAIYASGQNLIIQGNISRFQEGFGICLYSEGDSGISGSLIANNVSYGNRYDGILVDFPSRSANAPPNRIVNNTVAYNQANGIRICGGPAASPNVIANNICFANAQAPVLFIASPQNPPADGPPSGTVEYNVFDSYPLLKQFGQNLTYVTYGGSNQVADPGFVSSPAGLFWLTSTSPARTAGSLQLAPPWDFWRRPSGAGWHCGAFPYEASLESQPQVGVEHWWQLGTAR